MTQPNFGHTPLPTPTPTLIDLRGASGRLYARLDVATLRLDVFDRGTKQHEWLDLRPVLRQHLLAVLRALVEHA